MSNENQQKKIGRPSKFSQEIADRICVELSKGKSLRKICEADDMPEDTSVRRWLAKEENTAFRLQYARARQEQADHYADEIIDISDTEEDPQKAKVRIDARKWVASKLKPKKYSERMMLAGDEENPLQAVTQINLVPGKPKPADSEG